QVIRSPEDAAKLVMPELRYLKREHFICLFLDTKNKVIRKETISIGSLNASIVHPREVYREAIRYASAAILAFHNHPSTDPSPSPEDVQISKRLMEAGEILGVSFLDHIIIGGNSYVSLKEQGLL
ncbi:RadC family protein, partial [Paenibacillus senegalensis]|uniref:RadC family protein n=1 Tax=Paenibacillus senegalensis TaxID=1465766 RepID=UPI00028802B4